MNYIQWLEQNIINVILDWDYDLSSMLPFELAETLVDQWLAVYDVPDWFDDYGYEYCIDRLTDIFTQE